MRKDGKMQPQDLAPVTTFQTTEFPLAKVADVSSVDGIVGDAATLLGEHLQRGGTIEHTVKLVDGQGIRGKYLGQGKAIAFLDDKTGELKEPTKVHRFAVREGVIVRLLGAAQLDRKLAEIAEGTTVTVVRIGVGKSSKGRPLTNYLVEPLAE